jgi:hypothetical protein
MNRNLRVRPNSEGLTSKIRRENLESYLNVDGLPVQTCKPWNCWPPLNLGVKHPQKDHAMGANT